MKLLYIIYYILYIIYTTSIIANSSKYNYWKNYLTFNTYINEELGWDNIENIDTII